jgi:hypothetical protein
MWFELSQLATVVVYNHAHHTINSSRTVCNAPSMVACWRRWSES